MSSALQKSAALAVSPTIAQYASSFLSAIIESTEDAIITKTLDGTITSWNPAAERIYGYTAAEAVGQNISLIIPPDRPTEIRDILDRLARGERLDHFETDRVSKDGRRLRISLAVSPIRDAAGRVIGASAIGRDITARKRVEDILAGQRRLLEMIAESAPLAEVLRRIVTALETYSSDEVLGSILLLDGEELRHGAAPSLPRSYSDAIDGVTIGPRVGSCGTAAFRAETVIVDDIARDPLWTDFRDLALAHDLRACWSTPIFSTHGEVLGTFAMYYRHCRQPSVEDQSLLGLFSRIAAIAVERHRAEEQLLRQARELAAANQRKNDFLAVLGHELRNPLGAIGNALALAGAAAGDEEAVREALGIARRQSEHVSRLVDDLLDVSRIGRGTVELDRSRVELRPVIERAVESVTPQIDARGQRLAVELPQEPLYLEADPVRLGQVVSNLLANAAKYSGEEGRIWLSARRAGEGVELRVRDEGQGIEPEFLPQVFELFAQGTVDNGPPAPGLGIGLTLVRQLVELHGGEVEARSEGRGQGSEFLVRLPLAEAPAAAAAPPSREVAGTTPGRLRVLLVDDHEEAVVALETLLGIWGHEVRTAFDGPAALAAARELAPQLVLLDIGLPEMDGWEVARRLRRRPETAGATLVALTGYGQKADRARSRAAGFDHHLVKPVHPERLKESLAEWFP